MREFKTKAGYDAIEVSIKEIVSLGGLGICDSCNTYHETGFLVPVLAQEMCQDCFEEWDERAIFYEEDLYFEKLKKAEWTQMLKFNGNRNTD